MRAEIQHRRRVRALARERVRLVERGVNPPSGPVERHEEPVDVPVVARDQHGRPSRRAPQHGAHRAVPGLGQVQLRERGLAEALGGRADVPPAIIPPPLARTPPNLREICSNFLLVEFSLGRQLLAKNGCDP